MNEFQQQFKKQWNGGSIINKLIIANVIIFIVLSVLSLFTGLLNSSTISLVHRWLALSSNFEALLYKPWSIITYGFLFSGLFHILFSMLWVFWIGQTLMQYIGARKILPVYFFGILMGAIIYLLGMNVLPAFSRVTHINYGGSAGFMALLWATVTLLPKHRINLIFIGSIPLLYLAIGITAIDFLSILNNGGSTLSNLGGALGGFLYIKLYQSGFDISKPFNTVFDWVATLFSSRNSTKVRQVKRKNGVRQPSSSKKRNNEAEMNVILEKINKYGYESLSRKEKEFLFQQSKKNK